MATPVLTAQGVGDLISTTIRDLGEMRFTEIASTLQDHTAMGQLLRKNRVVLESGTGLQWDVMVGQSGAAANVGLGASDNVSMTDTMTQATADWRNSTTNYSVIAQVLAMNRTPRRIVDLLKVKRIESLISMAELMEGNFWGPPVALTDNVTPWGVNTWLVKNATQGFNGGAPAGYSVIGLNPTVYQNWMNWTDLYTTVSRDDFIRRARKAATFINWKPPVSGIPTFSTGNDWGFYTTYTVVGALEEALEAQNDNLGMRIDPKDGDVIFRRSPVQWVPKLESDTTNPFYILNWGDFKTYMLRGWWLKETAVPVVPGQHTVSAQFVDCTYQWCLKNRRTSAVLATGTTYPN